MALPPVWKLGLLNTEGLDQHIQERYGDGDPEHAQGEGALAGIPDIDLVAKPIDGCNDLLQPVIHTFETLFYLLETLIHLFEAFVYLLEAPFDICLEVLQLAGNLTIIPVDVDIKCYFKCTWATPWSRLPCCPKCKSSRVWEHGFAWRYFGKSIHCFLQKGRYLSDISPQRQRHWINELKKRRRPMLDGVAKGRFSRAFRECRA